MNIDFSGLRVKMVDGQVRTTDVTDLRVISAMLDVPREQFVPERIRPFAYIDEDIPLKDARRGQVGRYLMESSPFAKMIQLAEVQASDVVLDVGTGSGYSAAVLSKLCAQVIALESDPELAAEASANLQRLGYDNVAVVEGELSRGYADAAPYDVIVFEGAIEQLPDAFSSQLKDGGRLAAVVGQGNAARTYLYTKSGANLSALHAFNAAIKPLPGFETPKAFDF